MLKEDVEIQGWAQELALPKDQGGAGIKVCKIVFEKWQSYEPQFISLKYIYIQNISEKSFKKQKFLNNVFWMS